MTLIASLLATIDADTMFSIGLRIVIVCLVAGLLWWLVDYAGIPAPFNKVVKIVVAVIAVIYVASQLLSLT